MCTHACEEKKQVGDTALSRAAVKGHTACVRLFVEAGADKDAKANVRRLVFNMLS